MNKTWLVAATLLVAAGLATAAEDNMRLAGRMLFKLPELAKPGACVMYREGGAGWILTDPVFWLKGTTVSSEVKTRKVGVCPEPPGKVVEHYTREEFVRQASAHPCVANPENVRTEEFGAIRFRVDSWETPWGKRAATSGRLYHGHFLDKPLKKGMELEIDADLLVACQ